MTQFSLAVSESFCGCNGFTLSSYPISLSALQWNTTQFNSHMTLLLPRTVQSISVDLTAPHLLPQSTVCKTHIWDSIRSYKFELFHTMFLAVKVPYAGLHITYDITYNNYCSAVLIGATLTPKAGFLAKLNSCWWPYIYPSDMKVVSVVSSLVKESK